MAEAQGKLTGRPGICFVTRGPGATNASIAYENGYASGEMRRTIQGYDPRWDWAEASRYSAADQAEFKRGFTDGHDGNEEKP